MKAAITILVLLTIGLGVTLFLRHTQAVKVQTAQTEVIVGLSNKLETTSKSYDEEVKINSMLRTDVDQRKKDLQEASNTIISVKADLAKTQKDAQAAAELAKAEMAKRDAKINELESQRNDLTKKMDGLTLNIENLNKQIADTEKKLAASEGDREFLLKELKRMQAEKAELERQFNDLSVLRTQVAKLKEELSIARRLEWIRMGIYGAQERKGAEILMTGITPTQRPSFNLNVELKQDGTANIVPAVNTNAPAPK